MPSSFEIFQFWPNFDARVPLGVLLPALAQTDVRDDLFEACRRELNWLRFPSVRTKFPVERFQRDQQAILVADFDGSRPFKPPFELGLMFRRRYVCRSRAAFFCKTVFIRGASTAITFSTVARSPISIHGLKSFLGSRERKFDGEAAQGRIMGVRGEYSRRCTLQDETLCARLLGGLLRSNKFRNSQFIKMP